MVRRSGAGGASGVPARRDRLVPARRLRPAFARVATEQCGAARVAGRHEDVRPAGANPGARPGHLTAQVSAMSRLTLRQLLLAILVGSLFATLQGDPPVRALAWLHTVHLTRRS
jgi:hypothetical protein